LYYWEGDEIGWKHIMAGMRNGCVVSVMESEGNILARRPAYIWHDSIKWILCVRVWAGFI
jgi:hypothetical protein